MATIKALSDDTVAAAPVIATEYPDYTSFKPLFDFMAGLQKPAATLRSECLRLRPYFNALSQQLRLDSEHDAAFLAGNPAERAYFELLVKPENLESLFRRVWEQTSSTLLSQVVVAPNALFENRNIKEEVFRGMPFYDGATKIGYRSMSFGFVKTMVKDRGGYDYGSATFPTLTLDTEIMETLARHKPEKMLNALQEIMSAINHDMLHHYTNLTLGDRIAERFVQGQPAPKSDGNPEMQWYLRHFQPPSRDRDDTDPDSYESFLMLFQSRLLQNPANRQGQAPRAAVDVYFDEVKRIGEELQAIINTPAPDSHKTAAPPHQTVDYLNTTMGALLMRFLPLNHPLMAHALARMEDADPNLPVYLGCETTEIEEQTRKRLSYDRHFERIFTNYEAAGHKLLRNKQAAGNDKPSYRQLKTLQLINAETWIARLLSPPAPDDRELAAVQGRVQRTGLEMIDSVARAMDFNPA